MTASLVTKIPLLVEEAAQQCKLEITPWSTLTQQLKDEAERIAGQTVLTPYNPASGSAGCPVD